MHKIILSTGSNIGNRKQNLESAAALINDRIGPVLLFSSVYESPAWGYQSVNSFYNQCLVCETELPPENCLELLLEIEQLLGRTRENTAYTDRKIDIDILFFDDWTVDSASLKIPHERIAERRFVLLPMVEILPDYVHPVLLKTMHDLLENCHDSIEVSPVK